MLCFYTRRCELRITMQKRVDITYNRQRLITNYSRMEHEANLLWINSDSSYNYHEAWLRENFRKNERPQVLTVKSDNVLEPAVINKVNQMVNQGMVVVVVVGQ